MADTAFEREGYRVDVVHENPLKCCECGTMMYLYAICAQTGPIKIGMSKDVTRRQAALQTGHPYTLGVVYAYPVDSLFAADMERSIHEELAVSRTSGEWFDVSVERAIIVIQSEVIDYYCKERTRLLDRIANT